MSHTLNVYGIKPKDEKFDSMYSIYINCKKLNIKIPDKVIEFFNDMEPSPKGVFIEMTDLNKIKDSHDKYYKFEINIEDIPKDVKIIIAEIS